MTPKERLKRLESYSVCDNYREKEEDFREIADIIIKVLRNPGDKKLLKECKNEALAITKKYPLKNIK